MAHRVSIRRSNHVCASCRRCHRGLPTLVRRPSLHRHPLLRCWQRAVRLRLRLVIEIVSIPDLTIIAALGTLMNVVCVECLCMLQHDLAGASVTRSHNRIDVRARHASNVSRNAAYLASKVDQRPTNDEQCPPRLAHSASEQIAFVRPTDTIATQERSSPDALF